MPTIKDITALRHQGKLDEAYKLALYIQTHNPGEWADTAMFWVLRDMVMQLLIDSTDQNIEQAHHYLDIMENLLDRISDPSGVGANTITKIKRAILPNYNELMQCVELSKKNPSEAYNKSVIIAGKQGERLNVILHEDLGWIMFYYLKSLIENQEINEIRAILRDYLMLKNKRPSLLHSMILNIALQLAKMYPDFIFSNFIKLWGVNNFRREDLSDGYNNDKCVPSLISRVCARLSISNEPLVKELSEGTGLDISIIIDMYRKAFFWWMYNSKNNVEFLSIINSYSSRYGMYPSTEYHSEILKLVTKKLDENKSQQFVDFILKCKDAGFCERDWVENIDKNGRHHSSLVVQLAKRCFEHIKESKKKYHSDFVNSELIKVLSEIYDMIELRNAGDEWTARQRAIISVWIGDKEDAVSRYRNLLEIMGEKYYIWQEMAQCVEEPLLRVGFLLRALELEKTESLIGPLRLQIAEILIDAGYTSDARKYLNDYAVFRNKQGKICPDCWRVLYERANSVDSEVSLNKNELVFNAMNFAYSDYAWRDFVLIGRFIVEGKSKISFTDGKTTFSVPMKRFKISKHVELGSIVRFKCMEDETKIIPLMFQIADLPKWSILPEDFAYVTYVNESKSAVSVITSHNEETFFLDNDKVFNVGDIISFRRGIKRTKQNNIIVDVLNPIICRKENALHVFERCTVAVDRVNMEKSLFHIMMEENLTGYVIRFADTELRPKVGDLLKLTYCIRTNNEGRKMLIVIDLQFTDETSEKLIKEVEGRLELKYKNRNEIADFGFVAGFYVPKHILQNERILKDCYVKAKAIIGNDGKWKVYKVVHKSFTL